MAEPLRVLIVDDSRIFRAALVEAIQSIPEARVVESVFSGEKALQVLAERPVDLVTLDFEMPGMDGLEAARIITKERLCGVLILTAFSQREVIEEARDAGALAYLVKPFQKHDLLNKSLNCIMKDNVCSVKTVFRNFLKNIHCFLRIYNGI